MLNLLDRKITQSAIEKIHNNKILFIVGPRKSGKSQLLADALGNQFFDNKLYKKYNCDNHNVRKILENKKAKEIYQIITKYSYVFFEEAQNLENLDEIIKAADMVYTDSIESNNKLRIVFTMSSVARRKPKYLQTMRGHYELFYVLPFGLKEVVQDSNIFDFEKVMRFGLYPEVYQSNEEDAIEVLEEIVREFLCRDIFMNNTINKTRPLLEILRQLSLHIGEEISISKLAKYSDVDDRTVERYLNLLVEAFIIFRHRPFSRRGKNEVKVRDKYYFYDLGIRNALIGNYGEISNRQDRDKMWENLCIAERRKALRMKGDRYNSFFWRTHSDQNVDFIEEENTWLIPYKFTWNDFHLMEKLDPFTSTPSGFKKLYGIETQMHVSQANLLDFLEQ